MTLHYDIREELHTLVIKDLLGPAEGEEEIVEERNVRGRYLVGLLAPKGASVLPDPEDYDEELPNDEDVEEGTPDAPPSKAAISILPSTMGLSFEVADNTDALQLSVSWGWYQRYQPDTATPEAEETEAAADDLIPPEETPAPNAKKPYVPRWKRTPVSVTSEPLYLSQRAVDTLPHWHPSPDQPDVYLQIRTRRHAEGWSVTVFLINGQNEPSQFKDSAWLFQPEISVTAPDKEKAIFRRRPLPHGGRTDEDIHMAILYRDQIEFAVGHGVAVEARRVAGTNRANRLSTRHTPLYEVPQSNAPNPQDVRYLDELVTDMKTLAEHEGKFAPLLNPLVNAYSTWIEDLRAELNAPPPDLANFVKDDTEWKVARDAVMRCGIVLERIQDGINLLDRDPAAARAFRFANRAMYQQRVHSLYTARMRQGNPILLEEIDQPRNRSWRAFQLAFVLMNVAPLTQLDHPDRAPQGDDLAGADLLWFPTGGGKTEAYLGVAAYTMAIRRLQGVVEGRNGGAGIAVLMRYTLRLLTLQQFQRAAALLCACETIRRDNPQTWGAEPFRLGLWVGQRTTPNWTKDAAEAVKQLRDNNRFSMGSTPHQLTNCPWCGRRIDPGKHIVSYPPGQGSGRTLVFCGDELGECPFSRVQAPDEGIPVIVVDEEIYRRLPTMLIATVDKFAQLPWNGRTAMLFGQVDGYCSRHGYRSPEVEDTDSHPKMPKYGLAAATTTPVQPLRPPDLIIQDELHLISGPLGTMVGLYETAVDALATWTVNGKQVQPRLIASSATVRRAGNQVKSLFKREVTIFPPPGLKVEDSFFARQRPVTPEHFGRRYVGICAPGIRHKAALIRVYGAAMAAAQQLYEHYGQDADPYMTLVGYFNAMRELGSMRRAVDDSVTSRLRRMRRRGLANRSISPYSVEELTSRKDATDIPDILDRLELSFPPPGDKTTSKKSTSRALDVLLATNMLSVGVDVSRLGLMVVAGQPKNTAEYIQATSRVGRQFPGLVFVVYNWTRPRDLSHYERFRHYHATFYQHVEALSVTPFAPGALQRGLSALLVSLVRLGGLELNSNAGAGRVTINHPYVKEAMQMIIDRACAIQGEKGAALVAQELNDRLHYWVQQIRDRVAPATLSYDSAPNSVELLRDAEAGAWELYTCLNSLRNVEPTTPLVLNDYGMDRQEREWQYVERKGESS